MQGWLPAGPDGRHGGSHLVSVFIDMYACFACLPTACVPGACEGQKSAVDALGLELQKVVSICVVLALDLGPLKEQPVLLTAGPSLQPLVKRYELVFDTEKLEVFLPSKPSVFDLSRKSKLWWHWICLLSCISCQEPGSSCLPHTELLGSYVFFFSLYKI